VGLRPSRPVDLIFNHLPQRFRAASILPNASSSQNLMPLNGACLRIQRASRIPHVWIVERAAKPCGPATGSANVNATASHKSGLGTPRRRMSSFFSIASRVRGAHQASSTLMGALSETALSPLCIHAGNMQRRAVK
jgi:hypothetical protein